MASLFASVTMSIEAAEPVNIAYCPAPVLSYRLCSPPTFPCAPDLKTPLLPGGPKKPVVQTLTLPLCSDLKVQAALLTK